MIRPVAFSGHGWLDYAELIGAALVIFIVLVIAALDLAGVL